MDRKTGISKVVNLMTQIDSLNEEIKEILDECKESGHEPSVIKAVASAVVKNNVEKVIQKSESTLEAIEDFRN